MFLFHRLGCKIRRDLRLLPGRGLDRIAARLPSARAIAGVHALLGKEWTPEEADLVEQHREMTSRISWKPYMHSLTLRHLLPGATTPTLLLCGREDAITPLECGELYQRAIRARGSP